MDETKWVINDEAQTNSGQHGGTDYVFPEDWGLRSPEQKDEWYKRERAYRRAMRQDTQLGEQLREHHSPSEYRVF